MRFLLPILLIVLTVPTLSSGEKNDYHYCYKETIEDGVVTQPGKPGQYYSPLDYCVMTDNGKVKVNRRAVEGECTAEGCTTSEQLDGTRVRTCCCKGDMCNAPADTWMECDSSFRKDGVYGYGMKEPCTTACRVLTYPEYNSETKGCAKKMDECWICSACIHKMGCTNITDAERGKGTRCCTKGEYYPAAEYKDLPTTAAPPATRAPGNHAAAPTGIVFLAAVAAVIAARS